MNFLFVITSPTVAVAKYCNERVCLSVCLSVLEDIVGTTRAIFTIFLVHAAYGRGSVLLSQGDEIPTGREQFRVFSSPLTMRRTTSAAKWGVGLHLHTAGEV